MKTFFWSYSNTFLVETGSNEGAELGDSLSVRLTTFATLQKDDHCFSQELQRVDQVERDNGRRRFSKKYHYFFRNE